MSVLVKVDGTWGPEPLKYHIRKFGDGPDVEFENPWCIKHGDNYWFGASTHIKRVTDHTTGSMSLGKVWYPTIGFYYGPDGHYEAYYDIVFFLDGYTALYYEYRYGPTVLLVRGIHHIIDQPDTQELEVELAPHPEGDIE